MDRYKLRSDLPWYAHALYWVSLLAFLALFIIFALPVLDTYVATPFADSLTNFIFGPEPASQ